MKFKIGDKVNILTTTGSQLYGNKEWLESEDVGKSGIVFDIGYFGGADIIYVKIDDFIVKTFFSSQLELVEEKKVIKTPTSFSLSSPNFKMLIYRDECYLRPYFADSMEFSISYDDIDELINILQETKKTRREFE